MEKRIVDKEVILDDRRVKSFFDNRENKKLPHRYNYVNYQDDNPSLAVERDKIEKERIKPYFHVDEDSMVLDIGCGVGRWGDEFVPELKQTGKYVGIDYTKFFIDIANNHFNDEKNASFLVGSFQNVCEVLKNSSEYRKYDRILINGVLMYINDRDIPQCLKSVEELLNTDGMLYIKESVGTNHRLTLNEFPSKELEADYSVIYRSLKEYSRLFTEYFLGMGYTMIAAGATWDDYFDYEKETTNWYWILKK